MTSDASRRAASWVWAGITFAGLAVIAVAQVGLAHEGEVRGSLRSTDLYNTKLGATVLDTRLDAEGEFSYFTLGSTYRGYHLSDTHYNPRGIEVPQPIMKHRYAEFRVDSLGPAGSIFLRAGHFFATFDRGLTLRSFEDVDLEKDTALDGILGEYQVGGVKLSGLSGKATERVSDIQYNEHRLSGGRVVVAREGLVSVAASALARETERHDKERALPAALSKFYDTVLGGEAELWLGPTHLVGDFAHRQGDYYPDLRQGKLGGHAGYVSGTVSTQWLTLLGEYKQYWRFTDLLVNPPTCVREHLSTLMNRTTHVVDLADERGYLAEGTLTVLKDTPITFSASEARKANRDLAHWEMFGQLERPITDLVGTTWGGAWSREYSGGGLTEYKTGMLEGQVTPQSGKGVDFGFGLQTVEEHPKPVFNNYLGSLTFYPTDAITLSAVAEGTNQDGLKQNVWVYGEVGVNVAEGLDASIGGGSERGGKKCSGGVCYTEPEFTGVRLRFSKSF
ncbi:MAG TPA: DUF6029 family protein [bacterium]|nr:DUF6029 family protein [bacterium]